MPPNFRVLGGERWAKIDACHSSSSSADGYEILYYHHAQCMHLWLVAEAQENFTRHCSRCEAICGSGGLVPPTPYIVNRWRWSALYTCCFTSGEGTPVNLWIWGLVDPRNGL